MDQSAARLAETIRAAMKHQGLSGRELAVRVERLAGRPFREQYVSRRLSDHQRRPMLTIAGDLHLMAEALGLDVGEMIVGALMNELPDVILERALTDCPQRGIDDHDCLQHDDDLG